MVASENMAQSADGLDDGRADGARDVRLRGRGPKNKGPSRNRGKVDAPSADDSGPVEVAESEARAAPTTSPAPSLRRRLLAAQAEVETLDLDATIKQRSKDKSKPDVTYKGIKAEQVIAKAKAVLIKHGILYTLSAVERVTDGNKTSVRIDAYFENVDDPSDCIIRSAWGDGTDFNDKGTAKATTNANKTALVRTLNMNTLDFDETDSVEHEPTGQPAAVRDAEALTQATIHAWADNYKRALDNCQSLSQLKAIRTENAHMMKHPGVAQVTKEYFIEKITELESILTDDAPPPKQPLGPRNRIAPTHEGGQA